jgi:uracil-DNA glycosylase family 4
MIIGEMPGIDEGRRGRPFMGKSGRELRRYLNGYVLPIADAVYLTNYSKTVVPTVKDLTFTAEDEIQLWTEIAAVRPSVIAALGSNVVQYLLGEGTSIEMVHGIPHDPRPQIAQMFIRRGLVVPVIWPMNNPAAMLHSPKLQSIFAYDMRRLSLHLKRRLPPAAVDHREAADYAAEPRHMADTMALDSEGWVHNPWCISASGYPYFGDVIRYGQHEAWVAALKASAKRVVVHSALHDLPVFRQFGLDLTAADCPLRLDDTMIMAYLLGLEPQGLKALAYRHAGMEMDEYAELTKDATEFEAWTWLQALADRLPDTPEKLTKKEAVARGLWPADAKGKYEIQWTLPPLEGEDVERAKAKKLILRSLDKGLDKLPKRWADGRAREILTEETYDLPELDADPPEATLDAIPVRTAVNYAGRDADGTLRVFHALDPQIDAMGLRDVYEVDLGILPMIDRMQTVGLGVDLDHFRGLSELFKLEERFNADAIEAVVGRRVNPNSGDQVAELIYDELKVHESVINVRLKKTDGGRYSTNDKTLEALKGTHPIIELIQEGREIRKLRGTYCDPMPRLVGRDGRLHPTFRITRTETGRLSASDPNVLALPKRSKRGKLVRNGFVAGPGRELGEWDLNQIEMCMFAHDTADPVMCQTIIDGIDLHYATAATLFGIAVPPRSPKAVYAELITDDQRFAAKAINFGILMGITEHGLLDQFHKNGQLHWTLEMCTELLGEWRKLYRVAWDYILAKHAEARRYGFVRDCWGRLRWLEGIHAADDYIRAEAERQAQATPTQSGAQGVMKRIMRAVWPTLQALRRDVWVEPLLQIHDALVLEYDRTAAELVNIIMMDAMTTSVQLRVPIRAAREVGQRLGELEK